MSRVDLQIVAVSDFRDPARRRQFEMRALLQVRSWWMHARESSAFRIVAVGDPPRSVAEACNRAGVDLVPAKPLEAGALSGFANKILGFESVSDGVSTLLVDADVVFLGPGSGALNDSSTPPAVKALPAALPRLSETAWREVFRSLGLEEPGRRIPSLNAELGIPLESEAFAGQSVQSEAMFPCYNSGVVWTNRPSTLAMRWREHAERLGSSRTVDQAMLRAGGDQTVLATALESLSGELRLERLPARINTLYSHLATGAVSAAEVVGLHFMRLFEQPTDNLAKGVRQSWSYIESRCRSIWRRQWRHDRDRSLLRRALWGAIDLRRIRSRLVTVARTEFMS